MDLLELIKNRRTIRKYKNTKVPREVIEKIVEAGRWAPSAHNLQPWKFVAVDTQESIEKLAGIVDKKADELYSGFGLVMHDTARNLKTARVLLLIYADGVMSKKFHKLGTPYGEIGNIYEIQSVTAAIENMLLYTHSINLGAAWYGIALFCEKEINDAFGQSDRLMAVIALGYPDEKAPETKRKDTQEILKFAG